MPRGTDALFLVQNGTFEPKRDVKNDILYDKMSKLLNLSISQEIRKSQEEEEWACLHPDQFGNNRQRQIVSTPISTS